MLDINRIAHTSILKEPSDLVYLISLSWDMYPIKGPTVIAISSISMCKWFII